MNVSALQPLGARVTGISLGEMEPPTVVVLRARLAEHGVLIFPGQADLDDDRFVAFLRSFGAPAFTVGETPLAGHPELNVVTNVGRDTPPTSNWHVDTSYVSRPPAYTALRAVQIPGRGGETLFSDQYRAYETLEPELRDSLRGRTITHVVTGLELGPEEQSSARHPVVRPHPLTGRVALYLTSPARCQAVSGFGADDTAAVVERLLAHSIAPDNTLAHSWSPGDVVMWDNACVLHRADHSDVSGDRTMHRGMVAGYRG